MSRKHTLLHNQLEEYYHTLTLRRKQVIVTKNMLGICCETTLMQNTQGPMLDIHE